MIPSYHRQAYRKWRIVLPAMLLLIFSGSSIALHAQKEKHKELILELKLLEHSTNNPGRDTSYIDLLNKIAGEMRYYKADSLYMFAKKALKFSEELKYPRGLSLSHMRIANYHSDKGATKMAIDYYLKALNFAEKSSDDKLQLSIHNNLSGEYTYLGDYSMALNGYLTALELAEKNADLLMQSIINENIANLYADQKYFDESLDYYNKVKRLNDSLGNEIPQAESMSNLASVYADMEELEYAMFNINQSIDVFEKHRILDWLAFAYETKGKVYLKKFNFNWALYWYHQSETLHKQLDDKRARIDLYNGMAEAHFGLEKDSTAIHYATEAFKISQELNSTEGKQKCSRTLYKIYRKKQDYATALAYHELFQELSESLSRNENKQSLSLLKTKTAYEKQEEALIQKNEKALAQQNRYIKVGSVMLLISLLIIYLVLRSKKLQERLTEELKTKQEILKRRESELLANNETKTKLFSIIGHDLRGPIGALQDLLKMFKAGEVTQNEFHSILPKLRADVDHIFFTLNNLLTWGYTQMNGSVTKPTEVPLENLISENINLLSEIADNKSIKIISNLSENTLVWSDPNQLDIVVRNLLSNALKFTPDNGMVTIEAEEKEDNWKVSVRDTGVGMDRVTLQKIFTSNDTHSTYGTANEKGTGLGLSLCKEMIEKNEGKIWVDSALRKGSTFYFTLPKAKKKYSKAV